MGRSDTARARAGKQQRSAESRRRASIALAQLRWLAGYPRGTAEWRRLDDAAPIALDGALIARSRRSARMLLREHRDALRGQVGDVDRWWAIVDAQLAWCARPDGALDLLDHLPPRLARDVRAARAEMPEFAAAIGAATSAWAHDPRELARAIAWLGSRRTALAALLGPVEDAVAYTITLVRLSGIDAAGTDALVAMLAVDAPDPRMAVEVVQNAVRRVEGRSNPERAPAPSRSQPVIWRWLDKLVGLAPDQLARTLALLAATDVAGALAVWAQWERAHAGRVERAHAFAGRAFDRRDEAMNQARILTGLAEALRAPPFGVAIGHVVIDIDLLAAPQGTRAHPAVVRLLAALPASWDPVLRVAMLFHLARHVAWLEDLRLPWLWDALAEALERNTPDGLIEPWRTGVVGSRHTYVDDDLVEPFTRRAEIRRLVGVLARLAAHGPITKRDGELAAAWLGAGLDDDRVVELAVASRATTRVDGLSPAIARAAVAIASPDDVADLVAQATVLVEAIGDVPPRESAAFAELVQHLAAGGLAWLVRAALLAKRGATLAHVANVLALLPTPTRERLVAECARGRAPSAWARRYPGELATALARLARVDTDAEATAARRLAADLPDPAALRRELAVLRARDALSASAAKRAANLEARLATPRPPSTQRLARLAARLEATACAVGLDRLVAVVTAAANDRLVRALHLDVETVLVGLGDSAASRRTRELLFALLRLPTADRALAARLLAARRGPPPWDLRDDPVNQAFLDRLRAGGVDPTAWLDDEPVTVIADGAPLVLALERDPLEVFAMGAHFQTCLSPDGGNFFSVVANAADINKRVLYARRDGRVVGRCLLAITDACSLLVFNPYCHERIDFEAIVRDFALALGAKMGVPLVPRGTVSTLLARDWYDDGPRDLAGRFAGLEELRAELPALDPALLVERLRAALGRELDEATLPIVLGLRELEARFELLVSLVPRLLASTTPSTRLRAAQLALEHDRALADRLLGDHAASVRFDDHPWPLGHVIAELRPSFTLARLRETRSERRLRDDRGDRLAIAGVALAALRRPHQAAALFRLAIEREGWLRHELRARLAALGFSPD